MKQKSSLKSFVISTMLVAATLYLLGLPFDGVKAGPPEPTPGPTVDIITKLQSYQSPAVEPSQSDGHMLKEVSFSSEVEETSIGTLAQQTFYAVADATVLQGYPTENLGGTTDIWAGYDEYLEPAGKIARSLVKFNLSLPPNQVITKATLRVYLVRSWDYPNASRTIITYRSASNWSESSVTWYNQPGYDSAYGSRSIIHEAWGWYEFDVTSLIRYWYNGTYPNYGIILRGPEVSELDAGWRGFSTREGSYDPQLVVEYSPQEYKSYLPLMMKNYSPTPTATPSPCPQLGVWSGTTDDADPISFIVSNTSGCQVKSLTITIFVYCSSGLPRTMTVSWNAAFPISSNRFSTGPTGTGWPEVIGNFTSPTTATGTWKYFDFTCSGSGTWAARP